MRGFISTHAKCQALFMFALLFFFFGGGVLPLTFSQDAHTNFVGSRINFKLLTRSSAIVKFCNYKTLVALAQW